VVDEENLAEGRAKLVHIETNADFGDELANINVVIAAMTTVWARLELYAYLDQVGAPPAGTRGVSPIGIPGVPPPVGTPGAPPAGSPGVPPLQVYLHHPQFIRCSLHNPQVHQVFHHHKQALQV
jgi:hypothetical protein